MNKTKMMGIGMILIAIIGIVAVILSGNPFAVPNVKVDENESGNSEFEFVTKEGKYEFIPYDSYIDALTEEARISLSGISIASTKVSKDGFIRTNSEIAADFFNEYSDIFVHPYFNQVVEADATVFIVSSSEFDPLHYAYPEAYLDKDTNSVYFVFEKSHEHTLVFDEDTDEKFFQAVNENSKATYTLLYLDEEDLNDYEKIYFTVLNEN